jgi:hypothetical protein
MQTTPITSGLLLALDANVGITQAYGTVSQWADQSGNGNHFTQENQSKQPAVENDGYRDYIYFPGFTMSLTLLNSTLLRNRAGTTLFIVYRPDNDEVCPVFRAWKTATDPEIFTFGMGLTYPFSRARNNDGVEKTAALSSGTYAGTWHNAVLRAGFNAGDVDIMNKWPGSLTTASSTAFSANNTSDVNTYKVEIGDDSGETQFTGRIGEILLYDSALSDSDITTISAYLTRKWFDVPNEAYTYLEFNSTALGTVERLITGSAETTIAAFSADAVGDVVQDIYGTAAATFGFSAAASGTIQSLISGTAAATVSFFSSGFGQVRDTKSGTAACTLTFVGGDVPKAVNFRYSSRAVFHVPERDKAGEILYANVKCEFNDRMNYDVTIKTDKSRYKSVVAYDTAEEVTNAQTAAGRPYFRKFVQIVPAPGCFGYFFQVELDKKVHYENGFEFTGFNLYPVNRPGIDPEFTAGGSTLLNGWE